MTTINHVHRLRLVLPAEADSATLCWVGFAADSTFTAAGEDMLEGLPAHALLELIVPARRLSFHQISVPPQPGKHLTGLIRQALEDRLLGDHDDALCIPGPRIGADQRVWVCSRRWLDGHLERLERIGLRPDCAFPEYDLIPASAGDALLGCKTQDGWIFSSTGGALGVVESEALIRTLAGKMPTQIVNDLHHYPTGPHACDLLSGAIRRFRPNVPHPRRWLSVAALCALSALIVLADTVLHWRHLESRTARLQHDIRQTFAAAFPGTPIIDPLLQWQSKQREAENLRHGDALDQVQRIAAQVDLPIRPRRIEARDGIVRLTLTDADAVQFRGRLEKAGAVDIGPAAPGLTQFTYRLAQR